MCGEEVKSEARKQEGEVGEDTIIGLCKKFSDLCKFCLCHSMKYTSEENEQLTDMIEDASVETSCLKFIEESILAFLAAGSEEKRREHLSDINILALLSGLKSFIVKKVRFTQLYKSSFRMKNSMNSYDILGKAEILILLVLKKLTYDLRSISKSISKSFIQNHSGDGIINKFAEEFEIV